jgi:hypothetical protein
MPRDLQELDNAAKRYSPDYRLGGNALACLVDILQRFAPKKILELGPGFSSIFLYEYAREAKVEYVAIDTPGDYNEKHREHMYELGFDPSNIRVLSIDKETNSYVFSAFTLPKEGWLADLVIIDGPSGPGRVSRGALTFYHLISSPATIWLIDDIHRPDGAFLYDWIAKAQNFRAGNIPDATDAWEKMCGILVPEAMWNAAFLRDAMQKQGAGYPKNGTPVTGVKEKPDGKETAKS